jgi:hypothetical protein
VAEIAQGIDQSGAIAQFRFNGAEVRHQETGEERVWVCSGVTEAVEAW